ncbi:hypothetical protein ES319_D01G007400v1 [Gossypium barbadense]|uniref:NAC domain-containing protein n=2 Tax=Gossypium TaxID=3633 RepID=A0A5J5SNG7_GOSBA|nr:hypothetical protein ES319_D01G007400v1 [Gossypium barbadense]TYG81479.1 hypothetical protein ES288_D01G008100v1 [Gossypium darwinii]
MQNKEQNFSAAANGGATASEGHQVVTMAANIENQNDISNPSIASNMDATVLEGGEIVTTAENEDYNNRLIYSAATDGGAIAYEDSELATMMEDIFNQNSTLSCFAAADGGATAYEVGQFFTQEEDIYNLNSVLNSTVASNIDVTAFEGGQFFTQEENFYDQINVLSSTVASNIETTAFEGGETVTTAENANNRNNILNSSTASNGGRTVAEVKDYIQSFPPGVRFVPTDEELIQYYLLKKVNNELLPSNLICEVDLYGTEPAKLTESYEPNGESEWYFFTSRRKKYPNGGRPDRSTENGFWKPTGMDKSIPEGGLKPIGSKKTLEFHTGRHPSGHKTEWKMHEYKVDPSLIKPQNKPQDGMTLDTCVLCKVYKTQRKGQNENYIESFDQNTNTSSSSQIFDAGASSEATNVSYPMTGFAGQPDSELYPLTTSPMPNYEYYSNTWFQPTVDGALNNEAFVPAPNRNNTVFRNRNSDTTWPPYHPYYSNGLLLHRGVNNGASTSTMAGNYIDNNVRALQVRPPNAALTQLTVNNGGPNSEAHSMAASRSNTMSRGRGEAQRGSRRGGNRGKIIMLPRG